MALRASYRKRRREGLREGEEAGLAFLCLEPGPLARAARAPPARLLPQPKPAVGGAEGNEPLVFGQVQPLQTVRTRGSGQIHTGHV